MPSRGARGGWRHGPGVGTAYHYPYSEEELRERAGRARGMAAGVDWLFVTSRTETRGQAAVDVARRVEPPGTRLTPVRLRPRGRLVPWDGTRWR